MHLVLDCTVASRPNDDVDIGLDVKCIVAVNGLRSSWISLKEKSLAPSFVHCFSVCLFFSLLISVVDHGDEYPGCAKGRAHGHHHQRSMKSVSPGKRMCIAPSLFRRLPEI